MIDATCLCELATFCEIPSVTGHEDLMLPAVIDRLNGMGAKLALHEVVPGRTNVLATWGRPRVLFSTHFDVVPPILPVRIEDETLYARGACDAKGQMLCQWLAIERLLAEGVRDVAWLGVIDEEATSLGAKNAAHFGSELTGCLAVVNGEPTENKLATGQRGVAIYNVSCEGIAAHSGKPELGRSAIWLFVEWMSTLRRVELPVDPQVGPESWNLGTIAGGSAQNVVPAHCEGVIMGRVVPQSALDTALKATCPPEGRVELVSSTPPCLFATPAGYPTTLVSFGSDAPRLRPLAIDDVVVQVGPGAIDVAHGDNEHITLNDLREGMLVNVALAKHFLEVCR